MSIKLLVESIEQARVNNRNLGTATEARLNRLMEELAVAHEAFCDTVNAIIAKVEAEKRGFAAEIDERDRDLVRLMEGGRDRVKNKLTDLSPIALALTGAAWMAGGGVAEARERQVCPRFAQYTLRIHDCAAIEYGVTPPKPGRRGGGYTS